MHQKVFGPDFFLFSLIISKKIASKSKYVRNEAKDQNKSHNERGGVINYTNFWFLKKVRFSKSTAF